MKHKIKSTAGHFLILFCLLSVQSLHAQDSTRSISLKEAIDLSIKNSHLLKNNKAKISEATAVIDEANERRLPDVTVKGAYLYIPIQPTIDLHRDSGSGFAGPRVTQAVYGMVNASLPIYTGGKLKYGIESAKYLEQASRLDAEDNRQAVILNTINVYSNLYKSMITVKLVKDNLAQSNQRVKDFTSLEKNGLVARNDLLKVSLQSSNIELVLLDAENNYKLASVNMALMLGLPEQTILVTDEASLQQNGAIKTIEEYEQQAMLGRNDMGALALRKKAADLSIKTAKANYLPNLALTAGYVAVELPNFLTLSNVITVGVGVNYSLSSLWKTKSTIQQAQARADQISANQDMLNDNIRMQINQAYQGYLLSLKKIDVYQKAVDQAVENYRITKNKFDNSLATTTDLLDADLAQLQTKLNVSNAAADAVVAYNKLLQTAGLLNN